MTALRLILRSLWYYRWSNVAALAGMALTTAVITGALTVGESMRETLRTLALRRLGNVVFAGEAAGVFHEELDRELTDASPSEQLRFCRAIRRRVVLSPGRSDAQGARVAATVYGIDSNFWDVVYGDSPSVEPSGRSVVINRRLAGELGVDVGDSVIMTLSSGSVSSAGIFATRELDRAFAGVRGKVAAVIAQEQGDFSLKHDEHRPLNVFADIAWLQSQLGLEGQADLLLAGSAAATAGGTGAEDGPALNNILGQHLVLADYGLRLVRLGPGAAQLQDVRVVLREPVVREVQRVARNLGLRTMSASVYLANSLALEGGGGGAIPYSVIASITMTDPTAELSPIAGVETGAIVLNEWAARELSAQVGNRITMEYYAERPDGSLATVSRSFALTGVVPTAVPGMDASIVPELRGVTDVASMSDWQPPFPVDLGRIREQDEAYWEEHRTTPKAFLCGDVLRTCWEEGGSFGGNWRTGVRLLAPTAEAGEALFAEFEDKLQVQLAGSAQALAFRPVRSEALAAARGSSDFGGLFLGLSMFLVGAAVLFVVLLFRLMVERRAAQSGILMACGCGRSGAGRLLVYEGVALSAVGSVAGLPLGVAYAAFLIEGINSGWRGVLGHTAALDLHIGGGALTMGATAGFAVAAGAAAWGARGLGRLPVTRLLFGWRSLIGRSGGMVRTRARLWGGLGAGLTIAQVLPVWLSDSVSPIAAFFGVGVTLLLTLLAMFISFIVRRENSPDREGAGTFSRSVLVGRSASRHWLRSVLTVGLISFAVFVVITVAANRSGQPIGTSQRDSGSGGFAVAARTDMHLPVPFESVLAQNSDGVASLPEASDPPTVFSLRVRDGDDASCLNIQRPVSPRVLGVPAAFVERGGFVFKGLLNAKAPVDVNHWQNLNRVFDDGAIPAFVDADSAQWILKVGLGDDIDVPGANGSPVKLRVTGLLSKSIFAGDIVVGEPRFVESFGREQGYGMFLAECAEEDVVSCKNFMRALLSEYAVTVKTTADILAEFAMLQNTYLSAFHSLGGLGLLLGAFGLVILMLREAEERRAEFAVLLAVGFRRGQVIAQMMAGAAVLLISGLAIGTISALVAVSPQLASARGDVPWGGLVALLFSVAAIGLVTCGIAAWRVCSMDLLLSLRRE